MSDSLQHQPAFDWERFFSGYEGIVVVGNGGGFRLDELLAAVPERSIFVLFNNVRRTVREGFSRDALLVLRCGPDGPPIVIKDNVAKALSPIAPDALKLVVQLRAAPSERLIDIDKAVGRASVVVDLAGHEGFPYPAGVIPSSGFAVVDWLISLGLETKITVAGFTGVRSARASLFRIHDWEFEQLVHRLRVRRGTIRAFPQDGSTGSFHAALRRRFPEADESELVEARLDVVSARADAMSALIDALWDITRLARGVFRARVYLRKLLRRLRGR